MDEKKRSILTTIITLVGLFFLITNFYVPVAKDNAERAAEYRQLKMEAEAIGEFGKDELDFLQSRIDTAISDLEERFPAKGKLNLVEQLARVPVDANIAFTGITHKQPRKQDGYQVFPVDVNMKAPFYDLIKYLGEIEASPLMIGIDNLSLRRLETEAESLDIKVTFLGFRLTHKFPSISKYLEERYTPLNQQHLERLFEPAKPRDTRAAVSILRDYNPFVYEFKKPKRGLPELKIEALSLKGILRVGGQKAALINDTVVKEGEKVGGMEVVEIQDYKVILMRAGKKYILKMGVEDEFIKP